MTRLKVEGIKLDAKIIAGSMKEDETDTEFIERRLRDARAMRHIMSGKPIPRNRLWRWLRRRLK